MLMNFPSSLAQRRRSEVSASSRACGARGTARRKRDPQFLGRPLSPRLHHRPIDAALTLALPVDEVHGQLLRRLRRQLSHADLHRLTRRHREEVEVATGLLGRTILGGVVVDSIFEVRPKKGVSRSQPLQDFAEAPVRKSPTRNKKPWEDANLRN